MQYLERIRTGIARPEAHSITSRILSSPVLLSAAILQVSTFPHLSVGIASKSQSQFQLSILALLATVSHGLGPLDLSHKSRHSLMPQSSTLWCSPQTGVSEDRRFRPSRVALNHATKNLDSTLFALAGSAPWHMMLLPPIHIPQAPLPLCSHPYPESTRLVWHGDARPLAGRPASLGSAPSFREKG